MNRVLNGILVLIPVLCLSYAAHALDYEPYPLEYWALREVNRFVEVSPDGKHVAMLTIASKNADPVIEVYDAADMSKRPYRISADPMEVVYFYWASDEVIVFGVRQQVRDKIEGFNQGVYESRIAAVNINDRKIRTFKDTGASIENLLVNDPEKIIISFQEGGDDGPGQKLSEAFRPRAYWEFDLDRGTKKLLIRGKLSLGNITFDPDGNPIIARGFDAADGELIFYYRPVGKRKWVEFMRLDEDSFEEFRYVGMDPTKEGNVFVVANNGADKAGLWSFNLANGDFEELVYQRNDVNVWNTVRHSNSWMRPGEVTGVAYYTDKFHTQYFDEVEGATYAQLEGIVPYAHTLSIASRSRDGNTMTVYNRGPRDPGTYYLLKDGEFKAVGSHQPLLESEKLAAIEYITYKARDGVKIPGFITIPNGKSPPYPLVVMPHGGPFVSETVIYDEWAQMLANNGYLVLQPQYRGSTNFGLDFYTSSFRDGGQGGYKMQDDKDDGALYLVEQGLADPDRMAMFGWSYGGYAALVAASRTPQIYQCVIAGAAVADTQMQVNYYRYALRGAQQLEQLNMWDDSISPINEVEKVNIPMLVVHGDVDQRVPPKHADRYVKKLDEYNKDYKFMWLEGADHFSNTLFYHHKIKFYTGIIDYLANDCGAGDLRAGRDLAGTGPSMTVVDARPRYSSVPTSSATEFMPWRSR